MKQAKGEEKRERTEKTTKRKKENDEEEKRMFCFFDGRFIGNWGSQWESIVNFVFPMDTIEKSISQLESIGKTVWLVFPMDTVGKWEYQ